MRDMLLLLFLFISEVGNGYSYIVEGWSRGLDAGFRVRSMVVFFFGRGR